MSSQRISGSGTIPTLVNKFPLFLHTSVISQCPNQNPFGWKGTMSCISRSRSICSALRVGGRSLSSAILIAGILFAATGLRASPLAPCGTLFPAPSEFGPSPGATLLASTNVSFNSVSFTNGLLFSQVFANDTSNPLGGLTFTYQVSIGTNSPQGVSDLSVGDPFLNFQGFLTDGSYTNIAPGQVAPDFIKRTGDGEVIHFNFSFFSPELNPGQTSSLLVIQTDATAFGVTHATVADGVGSVNISTWAPVPEPGIAALGLIGALGFLVSRRRQTK